MPKNVQSTIALISHASKVMLKIFLAMLQQYMNQEFSDVQAGFIKGRGARDQIANISLDHRKSKSSRKTSTSALWTTPKPLTVCITTNCGKFLKRPQTTSPASYEICMQVKKQQLELDTEQRTGSKLGKEYIKAVYFNPAYLTSMQSTSCKMQAEVKIAGRNINNIRYADDTTVMAENEELKNILKKVKEESEKAA